jgi:hypothetical protein
MYNREIATAVDINTGMMMEATACINYVVIGDKKVWIPDEMIEEISDEMSEWDIIYLLEKKRKMKIYLSVENNIFASSEIGRKQHECEKYRINCYEDLENDHDYNAYIVMFRTNRRVSQIFIGVKRNLCGAKRIAMKIFAELRSREGNLLTEDEKNKVYSTRLYTIIIIYNSIRKS